MNHATRTLRGLKKDQSAEAVALEAHLSLATLAKQLSAKTLKKVPQAQRIQGLQRLVPALPEIPPVWAASLFSVHMKDLQIKTQRDVEAWVQAVLPFPVPGL